MSCTIQQRVCSTILLCMPFGIKSACMFTVMVSGMDLALLLFQSCKSELLPCLITGKKLDQKIEQTIMGSGVLLLTLVAVVLIVRDTINLGSGKPFM